MKQEKKDVLIRPEPPFETGENWFDPTDPQGCYTGRPVDLFDQPVQDADDL